MSLRSRNSSCVLALITMVSELLKTVYMPYEGSWAWVSQF